MLIRDIGTASYFTSRDGCTLSELLHPKNDPELAMDMSLCHAVLAPGEATVPHRLERQTEVYYILSGEGKMYVRETGKEEETAMLRPGRAVAVPPGAVQWVANSGTDDLVFLAVCQPQWREEDEVIVS